MKLKELKNEYTKQTNIMNNLHKEGKVEEAFEIMNKIENLEKEIKILEKLEQNSKESDLQNLVVVNEPKQENFYDMIKNPAKFANAMSGSGDEGILLPETDIKIVRDLRREFGSLEDLITVVPTITRKGSFIIEDLSDENGLVEVDELAEISEVANLKFKTVTWNIKDYAGIIKMSKQLRNDTPENIQGRIQDSLGKKGAKTIRAKILEVLNTFTSLDVDDIDGIKEVINVKLDMALLEGSMIVMGQETFHYVDTLKDSTGNYLLQTDITSPSKKTLFGLPVKVVNAKVLTKGIIYVGNFKEAVHEYVLGGIEITNSEHVYFTQNAVAFKAIERFDIVKADDEAVFKVNINSLTALSTLSRSKK